MKKTIVTLVVCVLITIVFVVVGLFTFPYKQIIMSAVSVVLFIGFGLFLKKINPRVKPKDFFRLHAVKLSDFAFVFWCGVALVAGSFLLNILTGFVCDYFHISTTVNALSTMTTDNYLMVVITVAVIPAFFEELFFRGAVMSTLMEKGNAFAIFIGSAFFVLMHGLDLYFLSTFFAGIVFACVVMITKSIFAAAAVHLINNVMTYVLLIYETRLATVSLQGVIIYFSVFALLLSAFFIISSMIGRGKKELYKTRKILNEGEIVWAKSQQKQEKKS